jgi:hypothetical protein
VREAWRTIREEIRTLRSEGEETTFRDDDGSKKKIVNLH